MRVYFDLEMPSGEVLELCATLSLDGDVMAFDAFQGDSWVPLGLGQDDLSDLGIDMGDLRERARAAAEAQARGWL